MALTTLANVKEALGISGTDSDALITNLIPRAQAMMEHLKSMFSELRMNIVLQPTKLSHSKEDYDNLFTLKTLAGSPHAILDGNELCIESPILLEELMETDYYTANPFLDMMYCPECQFGLTSEGGAS